MSMFLSPRHSKTRR